MARMSAASIPKRFISSEPPVTTSMSRETAQRQQKEEENVPA